MLHKSWSHDTDRVLIKESSVIQIQSITRTLWMEPILHLCGKCFLNTENGAGSPRNLHLFIREFYLPEISRLMVVSCQPHRVGTYTSLKRQISRHRERNVVILHRTQQLYCMAHWQFGTYSVGGTGTASHFVVCDCFALFVCLL